MIYNSPFLIDVDGVLVDWRAGFMTWIEGLGTHRVEDDPTQYSMEKSLPDLCLREIGELIEQFNRTEDYRHLDLIPDAAEAIHTIRDQFPGSLILAVTAIGSDLVTLDHRRFQLRHMPFDAIIPTDPRGGKDHLYKQFRPGCVIDDHPSHVQHAIDADHFTVLFDQPWNKKFHSKHHDFMRMESWTTELEILLEQMS